ncbi:MAG: hypothetical protein ABID09_07795 [Candidatus Omnitrophota bacterium]
MKRILLITAILGFSISSILYARQGTPYVYEKIEGSEFYTYNTEPAEGMMEFSETVFPPFGEFMVEVFMKNNSRKTIELENSKYRAISESGRSHYFEFDEVEVNSGGSGSLTLKPEGIIIAYYRSATRNDDIREIYVETPAGDIIHFVPYSRLGEFVSSPERHLKTLLSGLMDIFKFRMPEGG